MVIKDEISAAVREIIRRSSLTKIAQSVTGYVSPNWNAETVRGAAKITEGLAMGALGGASGAVAGAVDGVKNYGFSADAGRHAGRVATEVAKESARPETVNRFNGLLGSTVANTAYNFVPGMVGIFSDSGAQKVRDAQDAIGLGKIRQAADDYNASAQEAHFRRIYGDKGWGDYVQNPDEFENSHPELKWSRRFENAGRTFLNFAAGFKGFGLAGKAVQPLQKVKGVGHVFKHPIATGAGVGTVYGVKDGIESGSVAQGLQSGLMHAGTTTMLLGGNPWVGGGEMIAGDGVSVGSSYVDMQKAKARMDRKRQEWESLQQRRREAEDRKKRQSEEFRTLADKIISGGPLSEERLNEMIAELHAHPGYADMDNDTLNALEKKVRPYVSPQASDWKDLSNSLP